MQRTFTFDSCSSDDMGVSSPNPNINDLISIVKLLLQLPSTYCFVNIILLLYLDKTRGRNIMFIIRKPWERLLLSSVDRKTYIDFRW